MNEEVERLRAEIERVTTENERLRAELAECEAARDDFFDDVDRYARQNRQLEKQALTPERCDRILTALQVGQQSPLYRRVAAILVEIYGKPWR